MKAHRWTDPFDDMSDEEFDAHVDSIFSVRPKTVGVSLRIPVDLLERVRRQGARAGIPYQTLMKRILDAGVSRIERRATPRLPKTVAQPKVRRNHRRGAA